MGFWQFCWQLLGDAFSTPLQISANIAFVLSIVFGILVLRNPKREKITKHLLWVVPLAAFIIITPISWVTTSYSMYDELQQLYEEAQQNQLDTEALMQVFEKLGEGSQSDTVSANVDEAIGVIETVTGEPVFLIPIDDASILGTISQGSPQTLSGLTVENSPIFMSISGLGYALLMINSLDNDTFEVVFMVYIVDDSDVPFILTLGIESKVVSQTIPAWATGFFQQKNRTSMPRGGEVAFEDMPLFIQIEAGVVKN